VTRIRNLGEARKEKEKRQVAKLAWDALPSERRLSLIKGLRGQLFSGHFAKKYQDTLLCLGLSIMDFEHLPGWFKDVCFTAVDTNSQSFPAKFCDFDPQLRIVENTP
jgi:hypothetical protein